MNKTVDEPSLADSRLLPNRWDDARAAQFSPSELLLYRSNLLGADKRVTNFGGGKTHSILALYHLFSGTPASDLPGAEELVKELGIPIPKNVKRAVFVGTQISPGKPHKKPDGTIVRTLWGEIAWQLGGKEAYKLIKEDDERATNPGNIGHAWVKALWIDKVPPPGFDRPELYDPADFDFVRARLDDNPIYASDANYKKTLAALPEPLRRAFLEGDWSVFAGQYFDVFEIGRHTARAEDFRMKEWWPRWISIDWGFHHPSAVYWHTAAPPTNAATSRAGCR